MCLIHHAQPEVTKERFLLRSNKNDMALYSEVIHKSMLCVTL